MTNWTLHHADCRDILPTIASASIHAAILDPPYPYIERDYGTWTESEWFAMIQPVVRELKRVLTPKSSAVIILQPNSEHIGSMRSWLWKLMAWASEEWNVIQDVYWFNPSMPPTAHCNRKYGLMRPAVKTCVWLGSPDAFRNQDAVLIPLGKSTRLALENGRGADDTLRYSPSGLSIRWGRALRTAAERGGSTPFNLIQLPNTNGRSGHSAGTPITLCDWWIRYITQPGQTVLDCFAGASTVGVSALANGRKFIGIEKDAKYYGKSIERLSMQEGRVA
jgi:DNA modification methylase